MYLTFTLVPSGVEFIYSATVGEEMCSMDDGLWVGPETDVDELMIILNRNEIDFERRGVDAALEALKAGAAIISYPID